MPYFHVYIRYINEREGIDSPLMELNRSEEYVRQRIASPYTKGKPFLFCGRVVEKSGMKVFHIFVSEKDASQITLPSGKLVKDEPNNIYVSNYFADGKVEGVYLCTEHFIPSLLEEKEEPTKTTTKPISKNIFIVHGRNYEQMKELKAMLSEFGLNPTVLHEKASGGLTLAEKLEKYSKDVGYAFVILTPDDVGCRETEVKKLKTRLKAPILRRPKLVTPDEVEQLFKRFKPRARQNVIFEMGYFWGLLKRKKVCCLLKGDVEKPSDIEGIVYIPFKDSVEEARYKIVKELTEAGYKIEI